MHLSRGDAYPLQIHAEGESRLGDRVHVVVIEDLEGDVPNLQGHGALQDPRAASRRPSSFFAKVTRGGDNNKKIKLTP